MEPNLPNREEVKAFQQRIKDDPIFFAENVLGTPLWEKEKEILLAVKEHSEVAVKSCHASGKTFTAARVAHWWLCSEEDSIVISTAPTFRQVKEILWREIRNAVAGKSIYPKDAVLETKINLGEKWFALGLSTDASDQFQGFHGKRLLVIGDESSGIPEEIWQAVDGLAATCVLMLGNPLKNEGRFANAFKSPRVHKITISAFDTPNIVAQKIVIPGLITQNDIERMKAYYGEDSDVYRVRVLGEFPLKDSESLIGVDEVYKATQREVVVLPEFEKRMGVDVARFGDDRTVILIRQMEKVIRKETFFGIDTMQITGHVLRIAKEEYVKPENIFVDSIGVGGGVVDRLREQGWRVTGVNVGEAPKDTEHYLNLRAELYAGKLKEWIKTGQLTKEEDWYELANIHYKFNSKGQLQIESKDDMKKRGLSSPDVADALMLTFAYNKLLFTMPQQSRPLAGYMPGIDSPAEDFPTIGLGGMRQSPPPPPEF